MFQRSRFLVEPGAMLDLKLETDSMEWIEYSLLTYSPQIYCGILAVIETVIKFTY